MNQICRMLFTVCVGLLCCILTATPVEARAGCPAASPMDFVSDDAALNACLAAGGTISLSAGSPGYIVETGLILTVPGTIFEGTGVAGQTPSIVAHPSLRAPVLRVPYVSGFTIRHLRFDGNKANRSAYLSDCSGSTYDARTHGYNLKVGGSNFTIEFLQIVNAMCGSALEVDGYGFTVRQSSFVSNGWSNGTNIPGSYADGLTIVYCHNGVIEDNTLVDSTDVALIVGPGTGTCVVRRNSIQQLGASAFAGLMVGFGDHANGATHQGLSMTSNAVYANYNRLIFGVMVGNHPWGADVVTTNAGSIQYNDLQGAVVLAAIDGISAGTFLNNTGANPQGDWMFPNCALGVPYTAGHFGSATIQPGWVARTYHGACTP